MPNLNVDRTPKTILKNAAYEGLFAAGNFALGMFFTLMGVAFGDATGLVDESIMSTGRIILSALISTPVMMLVVAGIAFGSDIIKGRNHFDAALGRLDNYHHVSSNSQYADPKKKSEFTSALLRLLPIAFIIIPSIIGAVALGHTSVEELKQVAIALGFATLGAGILEVPTLAAGKYLINERERNITARASGQGTVAPTFTTFRTYPAPTLQLQTIPATGPAFAPRIHPAHLSVSPYGQATVAPGAHTIVPLVASHTARNGFSTFVPNPIPCSAIDEEDRTARISGRPGSRGNS